MEIKGQMSLLSSSALVDTSIRKVFGVTEIKDKDQNVIGERIQVSKRKEIAQQLGLSMGKDDKDKLNDAIDESRKNVAMKISAGVSQLPAMGFFAHSLEQKTLKDGSIQVVAKWRKVARKGAKTIAEIAKSYGKSEAEVLQMIAKQMGVPAAENEVIDLPASNAGNMTEEQLEAATAPAQ